MSDTLSDMLRSRYPFEPEMIHIPAGEFVMGSDPDQDTDAKVNEFPQHTLVLPDYAIAKTSVTSAQYAVFLRRTRHRPPLHWRFLFIKFRWSPPGKKLHPVVNISWHDAVAYCRWLSKLTGKPYRLPSEAEYEKAARGTTGYIYPWGNTWEPGRCHILNGEQKEQTVPVDTFDQGASPYGALHMVGNVWEWTRSLWGRDLSKPAFHYPYDADDGRENLAAGDDVRRVLRGVSFYNDRDTARCASRYRYSPGNRFWSVGFRVAISPLPD